MRLFVTTKYRSRYIHSVLLLVLLRVQPTLLLAQRQQSLEIGALGQTTNNLVSGPYYVTYGPNSAALLGANHEQIFAGPFFDYNWGLTNHLSLEARAAYLFGKQPIASLTGGNALLITSGIRLSSAARHVRFYGRFAPGIVRFNQAGQQIAATGWITSSSIHFALDQGGGAEIALSRNNALRLDVSSILFVEAGQSAGSGSGRAFILPGAIEQHLTFSAGIAHSFGRTLQEEAIHWSTGQPPANEVTLAFAMQRQPHLDFTGDVLAYDSGIALSASHAFRRWIGIDTSAILLPGGDTPNFQDGGAESEFFAGVRAGLQRQRYGIFAKYRAGAVSFASTVNQDVSNPPSVRTWDYATDAGVIGELYPRSNHWMLRIDAGEQFTYYHSVDVAEPPPQNSATQSATYTYSPMILIGAGWRF